MDSHSSLNVFQSYLTERSIEPTFKNVLSKLFARAELPQSPFPYMIEAFRAAEAKTLAWRLEDAEIMRGILSEVTLAAAPSKMCHPAGSSLLWGLPHIGRLLEPTSLELTATLLQLLSRSSSFTEDKYKIQTVGSLSGSCAFSQIDPFCPVVELREDYLISGERLEVALKIFAETVKRELEEKLVSPTTLPLGFHIETPMKGILEVRRRYIPAPTMHSISIPDIMTAVASRGRIYIDGLLKVEGVDKDIYVRFRKHFVLSFKSAGQAWNCYAPFVCESLLSGVFDSSARGDALQTACDVNVDDRLYIKHLSTEASTFFEARDPISACRALLIPVILSRKDHLTAHIARVLQSPASAFASVIMTTEAVADLLDIATALDQDITAATSPLQDRTREIIRVIRQLCTQIERRMMECVETEFFEMELFRGSIRTSLFALRRVASGSLSSDEIRVTVNRVRDFCTILSRSIAVELALNADELFEFAGVPNYNIPPLNNEGLVVRIDNEIARNCSSGLMLMNMTRDAVYIQYAADTGLFETIHQILNELSSELAPKNPYPMILKHLVGMAVRFDMWQQQKVVDAVTCLNETMSIDLSYPLYSTRTTALANVCGPLSSVQFADTNILSTFRSDYKQFMQCQIRTLAAYRVSVVSTVCGDATLSRLSANILPTCRYIVDHVMIDGPEAEFAAQSFGEYVVSQVAAFRALSSLFVSCLIVGGDGGAGYAGTQLGDRILPAEVRREATSVTVQVAQAALRGESSVIELWISRGGTVTQLSKTFCFYFRDVVHEQVVVTSLLEPMLRYEQCFFTREESQEFFDFLSLSGDLTNMAAHFVYCNAKRKSIATLIQSGHPMEAFMEQARLDLARGSTNTAVDIWRALHSDGYTAYRIQKYCRLMSSLIQSVSTTPEFRDRMNLSRMLTMLKVYATDLVQPTKHIGLPILKYFVPQILQAIHSYTDDLYQPKMLSLLDELCNCMQSVEQDVGEGLLANCPEIASSFESCSREYPAESLF